MKIRNLKLYTNNPQKQLGFYKDVLGLKVTARETDFFEVEIGYSKLKFEMQQGATPYHFAFHIPPKMEKAALQWLKKRTDILTDEGKEIIDFRSWQAKSIYFYDQDRNILEFISRKDLFPPAKDGFSGEQLLGISEIGVASTAVQKIFNQLNQRCGIEKYTGDYNIFCAAGDHHGLFIIIDREKKEWFPIGDKASASSFNLHFDHGEEKFQLTYNNERLNIL